MDAPKEAGARQIVAARLGRGRELYVRSDALVVADAGGRTLLALDAGSVRSAVAPSPRTVRVTWSGGPGAGGPGRSYYDMDLDPGGASARSREGRGPGAAPLARAIVAAARARLASASGPERLGEARRLLRQAAEEAGGGGRQGEEEEEEEEPAPAPAPAPAPPLSAGPCAGTIVLAPGERIVGTHVGVRWPRGRGDVCVTDRGVYLVDPAKGLCVDLPLEMFEGCTVSNRTVSVRYSENAAGGKEGEGGRGAAASIELRVPGAGAKALAADMDRAYAACGAAGARRLAELEGRFARLTPRGLLEEARGWAERGWEEEGEGEGEEGGGGGSRGGGGELGEYAGLLAAWAWGAPPAPGARTYDRRVAAACILAGLPVEAAGGMTGRDARLHEAMRRHAEARAEYEARMRPLLAGLFEMQAGGLPERERRRLLAVPHWRIIHEVIEEAARTGRRTDASFVPPTARRYEMLAADVGARMLPRNGGGGGGRVDRTADAMHPPCPWTAGEAARILDRHGYAEAVGECDRTRARYGMLDIVSPLVLSLLAGRALRDEARVRAMRAYRAWAAGAGAGGDGRERAAPPLADPYDYSWIRHLVASTPAEADEMIRASRGMDGSPMAALREAHARSLEARARISGAVVPPSIPRGGVHYDAWYDPAQGAWMSANPLAQVASSPLAALGPDECERLHGVRAAAFDASDVSMRHGMPAVAAQGAGGGGGGGAMVLLPTVPDSAVTREMVVDKELGALAYAPAEPGMCVSNEGLLCPYTHAEYAAVCGSPRAAMPEGSEAREWAAGSAVLPLPERLRRFEFASRTGLLGVRPDM